MFVLLVKFLGEWAIWRKCETMQEAQDSLLYWQGRMCWPLKVILKE